MAGDDISTICAQGNLFMIEKIKATMTGKKHKKIEKGIAFPTCISVNNVCGHFSPLKDESYALKNGDIAKIDEDGFLTITDRLSRFSKIGGEMVPHGRVEEALHQAIQAEDMKLAVTAIPDERKGEQLIVLHTLDESLIPDVLDKVTASGLPNLCIPRRDNFIKVDELPVLGSGKLDLRSLKRLALERSVKAQPSPRMDETIS